MSFETSFGLLGLHSLRSAYVLPLINEVAVTLDLVTSHLKSIIKAKLSYFHILLFEFNDTRVNANRFFLSFLSMDGDGPKYEVVIEDENDHNNLSNVPAEPLNYQRARVLCSYDAKDNSELNLLANEVRGRSFCFKIQVINEILNFLGDFRC